MQGTGDLEYEDRYRLLVDLMPDAVVVHQDGQVRYANASTGRLLATSAEGLVGRSIMEYVHPDSRGPLLERIAGLVVPGVPSRPTRVQMLRADGGTVVIESVSVLTSWKGRPAMQAIMRDLTDHLAIESALRYQAALVTHVSNAIIATDAGGTVTSWNPAAEKIFAWSADEALGRPVNELIVGSLDLAQVLAAGRTELSVRRRDGLMLAVHATVTRLLDSGGYVLLCSDETAQREAQERFSTVFRSLETGLIIVDEAGTIQSVNPAAAQLLEDDAGVLVGRSLGQVAVCDESGHSLDVRAESTVGVRGTGPAPQRTIGFDRRDGSRAWLSMNVRPLPSRGPAHTAVISLNDITERRTAVETLRHAAQHDALTGLANRALAIETLQDALVAARAGGQTVAAIFVDLDNFKLINDSVGHEVGDGALCTVAERLDGKVRRPDVVARLGGDEFLVVARVSDHEEATELARRLLTVIAEPLTGRLRGLTLHASIGVVTAGPDETRDPSDLIRDADAAMYQAKSRGRNKVESFDETLQASLLRRLRLETDLHAALTQQQLWVAYQPIVDLRTGRWSKAEALLRWDHPVLGPIPPLDFIPIAEQSDIIHDIGRFVLETACRDLAVLRRDQVADLAVSVNLSARQLDDPGLVAFVEQTLDRYGLPPSALCLEITESTLAADETGALTILQEVRGLGVGVSIDDFGTGYSSLGRLLTLPVNELKIDRSFVTKLDTDPAGVLIVTGIITLAHSLGHHVVAEGVETAEHVRILTELGCEYAQGYHFARPRPLAEYDVPPAGGRRS